MVRALDQALWWPGLNTSLRHGSLPRDLQPITIFFSQTYPHKVVIVMIKWRGGNNGKAALGPWSQRKWHFLKQLAVTGMILWYSQAPHTSHADQKLINSAFKANHSGLLCRNYKLWFVLSHLFFTICVSYHTPTDMWIWIQNYVVNLLVCLCRE